MRHMAAALALAFAAAPTLAQDRAVPRGGGSSGGGSSSGGASHHSGGSSSPSSSGSSGSSYSGGGSSSSSSRSGTTAERRHPRAGTGTGDRYYGRGDYGGGYYGGGYYRGYDPWYPWYYPSSYYWGPYWGSYYYGYWPYGAYYSGGGYYRSYRSSDRDSSAIRVLVDPEDAKVYVDGYYAGKVDDFDGFTQRLYVSRGPHEILLKRDGYRSQRFRIYAVPDQTLKIEHDMSKGEGEEPLQDLTGGRGDDFDRRPSTRPAPDDEDVEDDDVAPRPRVRVEDGAEAPGGRTGNLRVRIWPGDASVYVDGEFRGTAKQTRSLDLRPGTHRIEIVRPGFETAQREVEIDGGESHDLEVRLEQP